MVDGELRGDAGDVNTHSVTIRQGGARSVTAHEVSVRQGGIARVDAHSAVGLLLTGRLEGQGVRVLMGPQAAFAFGAGAALVLSLLGLWRRRA